jgi:truncated hemoglobin YjbI
MAEQNLSSLNTIEGELFDLSSRVHGIVARLHNLKLQVQSCERKDSLGQTHPDLGHMRTEIKKAKESISQFKSMISAASFVQSGNRKSDSTLKRLELVGVKRQDDKSKPLIDRLGGELLLETLVELAYARFVADSRLRAFFDLNARKVTTIKKRLLQFLIGYLGGKSNYDESNLKPAHYHMNITDYHLEAFLDIMKSVMEVDLKSHPNAVHDVIAALSKVRKDIVTGYTIRCELARINTDQGIEILFRKLGGLEGIIKFTDRLYDVIAVDNRIRKFFSGSNYEAIRRGQRAYITGLVGGPKLFTGRSMEEIHRNLGIDDYYFDCFLQDAEKALSWMGFEDSIADQVIIQLESVRASVLGRKRGVAQIMSSQDESALPSSFNSVLDSSGAVRSPSNRLGSNLSESVISGMSAPSVAGSLLVQIGGEEKLTHAVDILFKGCLDDPRMSFFFQIAQKREAFFKRAIVNVLMTLAGSSPARYDLTQFKSTHFDLNISDYHFDTWVSNLGESCQLAGIPSNPLRELLVRLSKLRSEITGGSTIRLEMAQQRTEASSSAGPPMCASLGGTQGINRVIGKLYELMLQDPRVSFFFQGSKLSGIIKFQGQFLANLLGAHETYTGRDIEKVHARLNVSDYHFDCFQECFTRAVAACGFTEEAADECLVLVETYRRVVVNPNTRNFSIRLSQKSLANTIEPFEFTKILLKKIAAAEARTDPGVALRFLLESHAALRESIERFLGKLFEMLFSRQNESIHLVHSELYAISFWITDDHVDSFLELVECTIKTTACDDVAPEHVASLLNTLKSLRGIATSEYRQRIETASSRVRNLGDDWIDPGLNRAFNDPRLGSFFVSDDARRDLRAIVENLSTLPRLSEAVGIGLSQYQFDVLVDDLVGDCQCRNDLEIILHEKLRNVFVPPWWASKRATLLERMGGESVVEQLVAGTIDKLTGWSSGNSKSDNIVEAFFDIPKSRLRTFKRRITRFLISLLTENLDSKTQTDRFGSNISGVSGSGVSSGTIYGSLQYLRSIHYNLNISDVHFDAFVDCIRNSAAEMGLPGEAKREFIAIIESLRGEIVAGWSIRSHDAAERTHLVREGKYETFYDQMGGSSTDPGLENFASRMYELVERDTRINEFFLGSKFNMIRETQGKFIISLLGGPLSLSRQLTEVHRVYNISSYHFDCFVHDLALAARDCGASAEVQDDLACLLEPFRRVVTCGSH